MSSDLEKLVWKLQYEGLPNDALTFSGIVYSHQGGDLPLSVYSRYYWYVGDESETEKEYADVKMV